MKPHIYHIVHISFVYVFDSCATRFFDSFEIDYAKLCPGVPTSGMPTQKKTQSFSFSDPKSPFLPLNFPRFCEVEDTFHNFLVFFFCSGSRFKKSLAI